MSGSSERSIAIVNGGLLSTVQDLGRAGYASAGVSTSGAADWYSARAANRLVRNADDAALIETTLSGITFDVRGRVTVAITGADARITIDGTPRAAWRSHAVSAGARVNVGRAIHGLRSYVSFDGGIDVPIVLGSKSTDVGAGFGGCVLHAGQTVNLGSRFEDFPAGPQLIYRSAAVPDFSTATALRVLRGPDAAALKANAYVELLRLSYRASSRSSRQSLVLDGEPLALSSGVDIISAGTCAGSVQVAGDGLPMLLLAEHHTTGGYPVALCVIAADIPRAAQIQPGEPVRFELVTYAQAALAIAETAARLRELGHCRSDGEDDVEARLTRGFFEGA